MFLKLYFDVKFSYSYVKSSTGAESFLTNLSVYIVV